MLGSAGFSGAGDGFALLLKAVMFIMSSIARALFMWLG